MKLNSYKAALGIPSAAGLAFIEKRSIELGNGNEIGPGLPANTAFSERQVWVGRFEHDFVFWELALDVQGILVRQRKSR